MRNYVLEYEMANLMNLKDFLEWSSPSAIKQLKKIHIENDDILDAVKSAFSELDGINMEMTFSKSSVRDFVIPRQIFTYVLYKNGVPIPYIANHLNQNRATIYHSLEVVQNYRTTNDELIESFVEFINHDYRKDLLGWNEKQESEEKQELI